MRRILTATSLSAAALVAGGACTIDVSDQGYIEREEKRFAAGDAPIDLHLYTFDGVVEVRAWDRPEIVIEVARRGSDKEAVDRIQILAEQTGNRIQLEARHPGSGTVVVFGRYTSPSATFIANVPRRTNLVVRSGDGAVRVERVEGRLELRTDDGAIRVVETAGDLLAETGDGAIEIEDVAGRVEARTDDGTLRISGTPGAVRARSGDGNIVLRIRRGAAMTEEWMVATSDGSISAELPDGFNAMIEADPGPDDRARSDFELADAEGGRRDGVTLRGRLGEGGHAFRLRSGDGSIRLTRY